MITNMAAYGLARRLRPTPIYEALLEQDGIQLHAARPVVDAVDGLSIAGIKLDAGSYVTFTPEQDARQLLDALETAGRQEVFPVLGPTQRLVGIITLDDLTLLAAEPEIEGLVRAIDIMRPPVSLQQHDPVSRALETMLLIGVRELPVVDGDQRVLGLIDEAAIAREYMRSRAVERQAQAASAIRAASRSDDP